MPTQAKSQTVSDQIKQQQQQQNNHIRSIKGQHLPIRIESNELGHLVGISRVENPLLATPRIECMYRDFIL